MLLRDTMEKRVWREEWESEKSKQGKYQKKKNTRENQWNQEFVLQKIYTTDKNLARLAKTKRRLKKNKIRNKREDFITNFTEIIQGL